MDGADDRGWQELRVLVAAPLREDSTNSRLAAIETGA